MPINNHTNPLPCYNNWSTKNICVVNFLLFCMNFHKLFGSCASFESCTAVLIYLSWTKQYWSWLTSSGSSVPTLFIISYHNIVPFISNNQITTWLMSSKRKIKLLHLDRLCKAVGKSKVLRRFPMQSVKHF